MIEIRCKKCHVAFELCIPWSFKVWCEPSGQMACRCTCPVCQELLVPPVSVLNFVVGVIAACKEAMISRSQMPNLPTDAQGFWWRDSDDTKGKVG